MPEKTPTLSGLFVQPIARRLADWNASGKLAEDGLEALSTAARAWVEHSIARDGVAGLADVEALLRIVAGPMGGETGLVEWADEIAADFLDDGPLVDLIEAGRGLDVDGPGFAVTQSSALLLSGTEWRYEGGSDHFSVRLVGLAEASPALKSLLGACLARLAEAAGPRDLDVRFEGIDEGDLVVFGERASATLSEGETSRLHRAALIP